MPNKSILVTSIGQLDVFINDGWDVVNAADVACDVEGLTLGTLREEIKAELIRVIEPESYKVAMTVAMFVGGNQYPEITTSRATITEREYKDWMASVQKQDKYRWCYVIDLTSGLVRDRAPTIVKDSDYD